MNPKLLRRIARLSETAKRVTDREGLTPIWVYLLLIGPMMFLAVCLARADELDDELRRLRVEVCTSHYTTPPKTDWTCVRNLEPKPKPKGEKK